MNKIWAAWICLFVLIFAAGCSNDKPAKEDTRSKAEAEAQAVSDDDEKVSYAALPENIEWITNSDAPVYSSTEAEKGGTFHQAILSFPMTFRTVGPDSNGSFRSAILDNQLNLINIHPDTGEILPELATHWAFGDDKKTMYFRLDKDARWSDGTGVTSTDFQYTLEFMRSEHIIAPWYNDYYTREIDEVTVYDKHTLSVKSTKAQPDLHLKLNLGPIPEHYYGELDENFVHKYNWKIVPNTGAYQIEDFRKGKFVRFKRKDNWWAKDRRYFKNRFNADYVQYNVVRDYNMLWEYFKKGRIDVFGLTIPKYWHEKSDTEVFRKGYVKKIWFFNNTQRSASGIWLNQDKPIFKDRRVRYAFAHAMNIERVIDKVLRGDYFRLAHGYVGYGEYSNNSISPRTYSIEKVAELMTDAGWKRGEDGIWEKDGRRFSVEVTYGFEQHTPRLVVLKEEARKAGVELRLQKLDSSAAFKKFLEKQHDVAWMGWSTGLRPAFWQHWHSDNAHKPQTNNITNTDDPGIDRLIDRYRESLSSEERKRLSKEIQEEIHEQGAFVPTFMVPYLREGYWRWIRLPEFHGTRKSETLFDPFNTMTGGLFWIDTKEKERTLEAKDSGEVFEPVAIKDERYRSEALE